MRGVTVQCEPLYLHRVVGTQIVLETAKLSRCTLQMRGVEDMVGVGDLESDQVLCLLVSSFFGTSRAPRGFSEVIEQSRVCWGSTESGWGE